MIFYLFVLLFVFLLVYFAKNRERYDDSFAFLIPGITVTMIGFLAIHRSLFFPLPLDDLQDAFDARTRFVIRLSKIYDLPEDDTSFLFV